MHMREVFRELDFIGRGEQAQLILNKCQNIITLTGESLIK
jgi:hypothetical protein